MTFATFGTIPALIGAAAVLGIVVLLQRLRARRRVVRSPAAALWAEALRAAPMRTLGGRFRDWPSFLLIAAIALLLWFAGAHPAPRPADGGATRFYLDATAVLAGDSDLARARRALLADVRATPAARREVFLGDATGTRLLAAGESASLLSRRLDGVRAEPRPSRFADWLAGRGGAAGTVRYYGGWPAARASRGPVVRYGYLAALRPGNRGIVALGATPAASGRWGRADVLVAVAAADGRVPAAQDLRWTLDGRAFDPGRVEAAGAGRYRLRDVPAAGGVIGVALPGGDGFAADDTAWLRLPDRRPVRVAMLDGTPAAVRAAVAADDSLVAVPVGQAQVVAGAPGAVAGRALPAMVFADPARQPAAFAFAGPGEAARGDIAARLDDWGLAAFDAAPVATAMRRPIGIDVTDAARRRVGVWSTLFAPASPFARSAAMPVFVAQGLRWLGGSEGWRSYAKAGDTTGPGAPVTGPASLTDRATTLAVADAGPAPATTPLGGMLPPDWPFVLLLAAAGVLLGVEWWLLQRGAIP